MHHKSCSALGGQPRGPMTGVLRIVGPHKKPVVPLLIHPGENVEWAINASAPMTKSAEEWVVRKVSGEDKRNQWTCILWRISC